MFYEDLFYKHFVQRFVCRENGIREGTLSSQGLLNDIFTGDEIFTGDDILTGDFFLKSTTFLTTTSKRSIEWSLLLLLLLLFMLLV